jgi:uncharacterized protein (TIGR03437 family)
MKLFATFVVFVLSCIPMHAQNAPKITALSPNAGRTGVLVTILGANFGPVQGVSTVTFNGTPASPTSWSPTAIKVAVPADATTGNVVVTVNGKPSNGVNFAIKGTAPQ